MWSTILNAMRPSATPIGRRHRIPILDLMIMGLLAIPTFAQQQITVHGIVIDAKSRQPIKCATVTAVGDQAVVPDCTDDLGQFDVKLKSQIRAGDQIRLRVEKDNYSPIDQKKVASPSQIILFEMTPLPPPKARIKNTPVASTNNLRPIIAALVQQLQKGDSIHRQGAATALGEMGSAAAAAVPFIASSLENENETTVRVAAATALGRIGVSSAQSRTALIVALKDRTNCDVRRAAAAALRRIGDRTQDMESATVIALKDDCFPVRFNAALALVDMSPMDQTTTDAVTIVLLESLSQPEILGDPLAFGDATRALTRLGPNASSAAPQLIVILHDHEPLRKYALDALITIGVSARKAWEERIDKVTFAELPALARDWRSADPTIDQNEFATTLLNSMAPHCETDSATGIIGPGKELASVLPNTRTLVAGCFVIDYVRKRRAMSDIEWIIIRTKMHIQRQLDTMHGQYGDSDDVILQLNALSDAIVSMGAEAVPAIQEVIKVDKSLREEFYPLLIRADPSLTDEVVRKQTDNLTSENAIDDALSNLGAIGPAAKSATPSITHLLCSSHSERAASALIGIGMVDADTISEEFSINPECDKRSKDIIAVLNDSQINAESTVRALTKLLLDHHERVPGSAIRILRSNTNGTGAAIPVLITSLDDPDSEKRRTAIDFLPEFLSRVPTFDSTQVRTVLTRLRDLDDSELVREHARSALTQLSSAASSTPKN